MIIVEAALKSSFFSLFQRGKFRSRTLTPPFGGLRAGFWKRGEGEIFGRSEGGIISPTSESGY
jgi:hypothetical protein